MVRQATCAKHMASMLEETPAEPRCHLCPFLSRRGRLVGAHGCLAGKRRELPAWLERCWLTPHPCSWKARQSVSSQPDAGPANIGPALQTPPGSVSIVQGSEAGTGLVRGNGGSDPIPNCARCQDAAREEAPLQPSCRRRTDLPVFLLQPREHCPMSTSSAARKFGCVTQAPAEDLTCTPICTLLVSCIVKNTTRSKYMYSPP